MILSSWVGVGHVGLSAATPVLHALGHTVTPLPTTILSNHPGFRHVAGGPLPPDEIRAMLAAIEANGWLEAHDALLVGYLPSADHVVLAQSLVRRMRQAAHAARIVIDPILGDMPKGLYLPQEVAVAVRDGLVGLADMLTPNRFELAWLTGSRVDTLAEAHRAAEEMRRISDARVTLVTSPPAAPGRTGVLAVDRRGARLYSTPCQEGVPHGAGDVFAALIAAGLAAGTALGHLQVLIEASLGADHLRIAETMAAWTAAPPLPGAAFPDATET